MFAAQQLELIVEKADVEAGVVNHQLGVAHESLEVGRHIGELRLVGEKLLGDAVHRHRFGINTPPRVEVDVKMATGEVSIDELHTANFNHPIAVTPIQPGSLGVEHNLSHDLS